MQPAAPPTSPPPTAPSRFRPALGAGVLGLVLFAVLFAFDVLFDAAAGHEAAFLAHAAKDAALALLVVVASYAFLREGWNATRPDAPTPRAAAEDGVAGRGVVEAQLRQEQRMDALGRFAGGIAHDMNNLITVISGFCEVIAMREAGADGPHPDARALGGIRRAADRMAGVTGQLLVVGRRAILRRREHGLNAIVRDAVRRDPELAEADLRLDLSGDAGTIMTDEGHLRSAVSSLIAYVRAHGEGDVLVRTGTRMLTAAQAARRGGLGGGTYATLTVEGLPEFDPQTRAHLFEPFRLPTSERGGGLALAAAHGVVHQSDGHLALEGEAGEEARFVAYLPRIGDAVPAAPMAQPQSTLETLHF